jgi:tetratricopeptide (TPR) repeat protein
VGASRWTFRLHARRVYQMNDQKQLEALKSLAELAKEREGDPQQKIASVRVSPGAYLASASLLTFSAALLLRAGHDLWALILVMAAWLIIPIFAASDRLVFDGQRLTRCGVVPFLLRVLFGRRWQLSVADFENVDTTALRTLRRGGSVRYRYRTQIAGKGMHFVFSSGGKSYRRMVRALFPLIHEDKMDSRSRDLRDYLVEPRSLDQKTKLSQLAPEEVIASATRSIKVGGKRSGEEREATTSSFERANLLRRLANELRVAGRLAEASEAFRRALKVIPREAWLIYDFAKLLRSQASANSDARLLSKARAALHLATIRAGRDANLLALIGESTLECGDVKRAQKVFLKAIEADGGSVKARLGLADVALREGKLAHVIHHHRDAALVAAEKALSNYARREADYYARLNDDDEYLAAELRRINLLQRATRVRRLSAAVTNAGILLALAGGYFDKALGAVGWSLASSALIAWITTLIATKVLSARRKPRLVE